MDDFKVVSKRTVYKQSKVQVDEEEIILPGGKMVNWPVVVVPDFLFGVPVTKDNKVLVTKEWRQGPHEVMTQFTGARAVGLSENENLDELKRELQEELGLTGGNYSQLTKFAKGTRLTGFNIFYLVADFQIKEANTEDGEFLETIELPIEGLYKELSKNHVVSGETLLIAKLLEEEYNSH